MKAIVIACTVAVACRTHESPRPLLWAADKGGHTTYLLGTAHAGVDLELPPSAWRRFDDATTFVAEADLGDPELAAWWVRPPGTSLRTELGEADWQRYVGAVGSGADESRATAAAAMQIAGLGGPPLGTPMDATLRARAERLGKRLVVLETGQTQGALIASQFDGAALHALLAHRAALPAINRGFAAAYRAGDAARVGALGVAALRQQVATGAELERLVDHLLVRRNAAWLPRLEQLHADGGVFVAVGVLHLVGPHSVLDLLRADGFTIREL